MFFAILIFLSAILLEGIGTYVSILGLSDTFADDIIILIMAASLDFSKLIVVSLMYKKWKQMGFLLKSLLIPMTLVMMLITSYGVAGYMSASFQKAMVDTSGTLVKLEEFEKERNKLIQRKKEMDKQIAQLPHNYVTARQRLLKSFEPELKPINDRLIELDKEILNLKLTSIDNDAHLGPVAFISKTFQMPTESAVSVIIAMIVFVFDPLAVLLIISGNMVLENRKKHKNVIQSDKDGPIESTKIEELSNYESSDSKIKEETTNESNKITNFNSIQYSYQLEMNNHSSNETIEPEPSVNDVDTLKDIVDDTYTFNDMSPEETTGEHLESILDNVSGKADVYFTEIPPARSILNYK